MRGNYYRSLRNLRKWHSPLILVHVVRHFQNLVHKRNWKPYHLHWLVFPAPTSTSSWSGAPMPIFAFCFTFLHVLFERCNYFNNGCVLFSISFLPIPITYFFPVCLPGITHPRFLRLRRPRDAAGGGRATLSCPPAHALSCYLKHFFWVLMWQVSLDFYRQKV